MRLCFQLGSVSKRGQTQQRPADSTTLLSLSKLHNTSKGGTTHSAILYLKEPKHFRFTPIIPDTNSMFRRFFPPPSLVLLRRPPPLPTPPEPASPDPAKGSSPSGSAAAPLNSLVGVAVATELPLLLSNSDLSEDAPQLFFPVSLVVPPSA